MGMARLYIALHDMMEMYILDDERNPVSCDDIGKWGEFQRDPEKRRVARSEFGPVSVSTVFLGMDHSFGGGPPLLFETMIFGGKSDGYMDRYSTWQEAEAGHEAACLLVNADSIQRDKKLGELGI